jgi:hypothetical protein
MKRKLLLISIVLLVLLVLIMVWKRKPVGEIGSGPGAYYHHGEVLLPNPHISPGEVRTTDLNIVCGESAQDFRNTTESLKKRVYAAYDTAPHSGVCQDATRRTKKGKEISEGCEIDHIISLELGGADTKENLFPQPYNPPSGFGAHAKDRVENYLHEQVCKRGMPLAEAQKKIATDWYQVYLDAHLHE